MVEKIIKEIQSLNVDEINDYILKRRQNLLSREKNKHRFIHYSICTPNVYKQYLDENCDIYIDQFGEISFFLDDQEYLCLKLIEKIKTKPCNSITDVSKIVTEVIYDYFGGVKVNGGEKERLSHLKTTGEKNYLSAFKGTTHGFCVEKAIVAHQLFKFLGIDSSFVYSPTLVNGEKIIHAFNLISFNNQDCIYDSSLVDHTSEETEYNCIVKFEGCDLKKLQNLPPRTLKSQSGKTIVCVYNPDNHPAFQIDKGYVSEPV